MKLADNIFWILPTLLVPIVVGAVFLLDRKYDSEAPEHPTNPGVYDQNISEKKKGNLRPETKLTAAENSKPSLAATTSKPASQTSSPTAVGSAPGSPATASTPGTPSSSGENSSAREKSANPASDESAKPVSAVAQNTPGTGDKSSVSAPNQSTAQAASTPAATPPSNTSSAKAEPKPVPSNPTAQAAATPPSTTETPKPVEPKPAPAPKEAPKPKPEPAPTEYTVKSGDNPWIIAQRHGVTMKDLLAANSIKDPKNLQIGQVLKLPPNKGSSSGASTPAKPKASTTPPVKPAVGSNYELYTIKKGENPWSISKKLKVSHQSVLDLNKDLDFRDLKIGQQIKVPKK